MICVLYEALTGGCGGPGDGPGRSLGIFANRFDAEAAAIGKGDWGGDGIVMEVIALRVDGKYYRLAKREPMEVES
jgi:hypothetical protein